MENMPMPVISTYTRKQAIDDGVLIDVTETATEAGFRVPVCLTQAAYDDCVEWTDEDTARQTYQDEAGRLWDVLYMAYLRIRATSQKGNLSILTYQLYRVPRGGKGRRPRLVTLKIVCGPGDDGEPVITIMEPNED